VSQIGIDQTETVSVEQPWKAALDGLSVISLTSDMTLCCVQVMNDYCVSGLGRNARLAEVDRPPLGDDLMEIPVLCASD